MDGTRSPQAEFPTLRYANCWEDASVLCAALRPAPGKRILSIASGGDNSFALAADGAEVVAVDANPSQLACAELKQTAIRRLPYKEVLGFLGFRAQANRRAVFRQLESGLSQRALDYWTRRPEAIDHGFAHSGKFEGYFATFRRRILPLIHRRFVIRDAISERTRQERDIFYQKVWNNVRWRMLCRVFFSRTVMGAIGRDRATFRYVDGVVANKIMERARRVFIELPPHTNPFLEYILTGTFGRSLPRYLEPDRFEAVRDGLDRVTFVEGRLEEMVGSHADGGFDGFNLSDVFEYLAEDAGERLHQQLLATARPGARLAYWNMLVPRRFAAATGGMAVELTELAARLHATDQAFFYGAFIIEEVGGMNWAREFMGVALIVAASVVIIVAVEWWARRTRMRAEVTRKLMHLAGVVPCLFIPALIHSTLVAVVLAAALAAVLWAGSRVGCLRSVSEVDRRSHGAILYPLAILIALMLAGDRTWMFLSALLTFGVADAFAALVGSSYGRLRYNVGDGETKSLEGSSVFFVITLAAVALPLLLMAGLPWPNWLLATLLTATLATGIEAVSLRGFDNLLVPLTVCITLEQIVELPWQTLLANNVVLFGLIIGAGVIVRLSGRIRPATAIVFVISTYAAFALLNSWWALAPLTGFVFYVAMRKNDRFHNVPVWDRRNGEARTEPVYRAGTLQFLFRNPLGRLMMRTLLSTKRFNNLITARQRSPRSRRDIIPFIERHRIDVSEFVRPVSSFTSFADFFIRELRPETRPIAAEKDVIVAPCDGRIQWIATPLEEDASFEVKGETYTLGRLTGDDELAASFAGGILLGIYLTPFDYHRFCYPADGQLISRQRLGNRYFSVNAESLASGFRAFDCNVRQSTVLSRGPGSWAMIEVAGFYAGGIVNLDTEGKTKTKGMMKGYFRLGGSFIVLAFQAGAVRLDPDIIETLARGTEVRVGLGKRIGVFPPHDPIMNWKYFDSHRDPAMRDFANLTGTLYAGDPWYVPTPVGRLVRRFDPRHNPFFEYGGSRQFVAYQENLPAARCAAAVNPRMDCDGERVGTIGFFESVNDPNLAGSLLERALGWLRDQRVTRVYGPMNFSIWGGYRFKTGGFDLEPILGEPYNNTYYGDLIQTARFEPYALWYSNEVDLRSDAVAVERKQAKLATRLAMTERAGYRIVALSSPRRNEKIMHELYDIVMESYAGFLGFYPISRDEFMAIYGDLRRILRRNQLLLAYQNERLCGVMIQYWDWAPLMRGCRGKPGLLEALKLRFGPVPGRWIIAIIGIRLASMNDRSGLASALVHEGVREAHVQRASRLTYSLMGEHNRSMSLTCSNPAMRRTYTLYRIDI